jgi:hypothetical protein
VDSEKLKNLPKVTQLKPSRAGLRFRSVDVGPVPDHFHRPPPGPASHDPINGVWAFYLCGQSPKCLADHTPFYQNVESLSLISSKCLLG